MSEAETEWNRVDEYVDTLFSLEDDALKKAREASRKAGLPDIAITASQGQLLYILAASVGATKILEIGTLGGYSTIWMARALPPDGSLISLELEEKHAEVARENLARAGLGQVADVRVGPAMETLETLDSEGPFDFVFIDADKSGYPAYLKASLRLSRPGTLIFADNMVRDGQVADPDSENEAVLGARGFNEIASQTSSIDATVVQTVGAKGYDGFDLLRVR